MQRRINEEKDREDGADIECVDAGQHSGRGGITHLRGKALGGKTCEFKRERISKKL